jgi:chemotaxis protein MotA
MAKLAEDERAYCHVLRVIMIAFIKGNAPILAVEIGRRAIPGHLRPSFQEAEDACRNNAPQVVAAEAAEATEATEASGG